MKRLTVTAVTGLLIASVGLIPAKAVAQVPPYTADSDRAVLVALYNATDGPNWVNNVNWLSDTPIGDWDGVVTDDNGRVERLFLSSNGLRGRMPSELGSLANLGVLVLGSNQLTGSIPPELGNLRNLISLDLAGNQLHGNIPPQLGNLTELRFLLLLKNQLSGTIPSELGNLDNLISLGLSGNQLHGAIPAELGNLQNLQWLDLSGNRLSGTVPPELGELVSVRWMRLDENRLKGTVPSSPTALSKLEQFHFQSNIGLCAPDDDTLQEWLSGIPDKWGYSCLDWSTPIRSIPTPTPVVSSSADPGAVPKVERGFFTNSVPSPDGVEAGATLRHTGPGDAVADWRAGDAGGYRHPTVQGEVTVATRVLVNVLIALPFFAVGVVGLARDDLPNDASAAVLSIGALVVLVGLYVSVLSRPRLNLMQHEETLELRHPSMKPAFARIVLSVPFFLAAGYLLQFTTLPYVYPFVPFVIAMYLYFRGVIKYWVNHHTTYYVTDRRAVRMYRFIWLDTTEIPVNAINSISETRSFIEMITGRGSVLVASGIGARHKVRMGEIDDPGPVAAALRGLVP